MSEAIEINKLTKYYRRGHVVGVKELDLKVKEGEIFGFLGPNGAGKSTTIRLLLDLIRPTSGQASIFGLDVHTQNVAVHQLVGYLPGDIFLPEQMTGRRCLDFYRRFRKVDDDYLHQLLKKLDLNLTPRVGAYSKGNRQKLAIVLALMAQPRLLLLDEPTSGLDPLNQQTFYEIIREAKQNGTTVFFSTHILNEADHLCDRVGIIKQGQLQTILNIDELRAKNVRHVELRTATRIPLKTLHGAGVREVKKGNGFYRLVTTGPIGPLLNRIKGVPLDDILVSEPSLEDDFMNYYTD